MKTDRPSSTAIFVANGIWWVSRNKRLSALVPHSMGVLNNALVSHINKGLFATPKKLGRWLFHLQASLMQKASVPGFYLHFVLRKRSLEEFVRSAISDGAKQLVVIGAGFDTLSLRMADEFVDMTVIEIDHPATQQLKKSALKNKNHGVDNIFFLPLDLTENTMQELLLEHENYDQNKTSVFVAEGLLMYLLEKEVCEILHFIKNFSGPGSHFVFTYMEENGKNNYQFKNASWATNFWLRLKGEVFKWGLKNEHLPQFLSESGFQLLDCRTHKELKEKFLSGTDEPLPIGENIAVAQSN